MWLRIQPVFIFLLFIVVGLSNSISAQRTQGSTVYLSTDFNLHSGNVYDLLKLIPEIEVTPEMTLTISGNGEALVMLNNKPAAAGGDYRPILEQLTIDLISEIEIITGPSARYDAEANGGVINIKLMGSGLHGISTSIEVKAETGEKAGLNSGLMVNKGKLEARINAGVSQYKTYSNNQIYRENYYDEDTIVTHQQVDNTLLIRRLSSDFALGYRFNDFHNLELAGALGARSINLETDIESLSNENDNNYSYRNLREDGGVNSRLALNYTGLFSGQEDLLKQLDGSMSYFFSRTSDFRNIQLMYDDITNKDFLNVNGQLDYEQELRDHSLIETGLRSYLRKNSMNYNRDSVAANGSSTSIAEDNFHFYEHVHAGYFQWSGQKRNFDMSMGIRTELSFINAEQKLVQEEFTKAFVNLFPTFFLSYNLSDDHQLSFNYNRTIQRPRMHQMNPFVNDMNPNSIQFGNPDLNPTRTHHFELKYSGKHAIMSKAEPGKKSHNWHIKTNFRERQDQIYRATLASKNDEGVVETSFYNLKRAYDCSIELMISSTIFEWWKLDVIPLYQYRFQDGTNIDDDITNTSGFFQARLNSNMQLWSDAQLTINSFYRSAFNSPQGKQESVGRTTISLRQLLFENKVTLSLRLNDPFGQSKVYSSIEQQEFVQIQNFEIEKGTFELTLRFNFGEMRVAKESDQPRDILLD